MVPEPTATQIKPFQAIPLPCVANIVLPIPIQFIPSDDQAILLLLVPEPTATHIFPLYATSKHPVEKIDVLLVTDDQVVKSVDVAIEVVPLPSANHFPLPYVTLLHAFEKGELLTAVHEANGLDKFIIEFVLLSVTNTLLPVVLLKAIPRPVVKLLEVIPNQFIPLVE